MTSQNSQNSQSILLNKFRDNISGGIDAADMRTLINTLYSEMVLLENILDRADIYDTDKIASINQVSIIKEELDNFITSYSEDFYTKSDTYSKSEVQAILNAEYYKKSEVDALINSVR